MEFMVIFSHLEGISNVALILSLIVHTVHLDFQSYLDATDTF